MKLTGLIAATFTPLDDLGKITVSPIPDMVEKLINQGIKGLYICGSTGEGHSLSTNDRKRIVESFVTAVENRIKIIVNVGHNSITESCDLAKHAQSLKVDAISAAPPVYYKIKSEKQLVQTFKVMTEAAPEVPFFYYHIPALTGFDFNMEEFLKLSENELPTMAGIKFTSPNIDEYQACLNLSGRKYQIIYGRDEMLLSGLAVGAECFIGSTYNFMAPIYHQIIEEFNKGNIKAAADHQYEAVKVIKAFARFDSFPAQKLIMKMKGMDCGPVALPLLNLTTTEEKELRERLEQTSFVFK